jgi:hypothetical protein
VERSIPSESLHTAATPTPLTNRYTGHCSTNDNGNNNGTNQKGPMHKMRTGPHTIRALEVPGNGAGDRGTEVDAGAARAYRRRTPQRIRKSIRNKGCDEEQAANESITRRQKLTTKQTLLDTPDGGRGEGGTW